MTTTPTITHTATSAPQGPDPHFIKNLFSSISDGYDRANDLMTLGIARRWRKDLIRWSDARPGQRVLDCATGTGDLAISFKEIVGSSGRVIGTDFCPEMLAKAPLKAQMARQEVEFVLGDVMNLPYLSDQFDICSIAFGIRNVNEPLTALKEMARVTRSGGLVMILETGDSRFPILGPLIHYYFQVIVPLIGGLVTGKRPAYEYLCQSSKTFPGKEKFISLMNSTGVFSQVQCRSLMGGASYLYKGIVK